MYLMCRGSKWEKDGKSVKSHPRIEIKSLDKEMTLLKIINITANDAGNYLCIKTTDAGVHKQLIEIVVISEYNFFGY